MQLPQHPHLDTIDQLIRVIGWPSLLGVLVWAIRTYDKGRAQFVQMDKNTQTAVDTVTEVKNLVTVMQTNHLAHLQTGIEQVAKSNDKAVEVLGRIDTNIQILADRMPRA
jgi:hypothetical protein